MTRVISGFPGIGKSNLFNQNPEKISDSDSSKFSKDNFPENYLSHIKEVIKTHDVVLVSSHEDVRNALVDSGIHFILVYPALALKQEYLERYKSRGSTPQFIEMMDRNWIKFIKQCKDQKNCDHIVLNAGQFLTDVITI